MQLTQAQITPINYEETKAKAVAMVRDQDRTVARRILREEYGINITPQGFNRWMRIGKGHSTKSTQYLNALLKAINIRLKMEEEAAKQIELINKQHERRYRPASLTS